MRPGEPRRRPERSPEAGLFREVTHLDCWWKFESSCPQMESGHIEILGARLVSFWRLETRIQQSPGLHSRKQQKSSEESITYGVSSIRVRRVGLSPQRSFQPLPISWPCGGLGDGLTRNKLIPRMRRPEVEHMTFRVAAEIKLANSKSQGMPLKPEPWAFRTSAMAAWVALIEPVWLSLLAVV